MRQAFSAIDVIIKCMAPKPSRHGPGESDFGIDFRPVVLKI